MITIPITFETLNGDLLTRDYMFHLNKKEALEMELSTPNGGMTSLLRNLIKEGDMQPVLNKYEEILKRAYGRPSDDGMTFYKDKDEQDAFAKTEAFSELFTELATDKEKAASFIAGVLPSKNGSRINAEEILNQAEKEFEKLVVENNNGDEKPPAIELVKN